MTKHHVGTSPAGVEWNVYRREGEGPGSFIRRVRVQTERLKQLHARADQLARNRASELVRARKLTRNQVALLNDEWDRIENTVSASWCMDVGATYVEATREGMRELADGIAFRLDDDHASDVAGENNKDLTDAQVALGARSRQRSIAKLVHKLQSAVDGPALY